MSVEKRRKARTDKARAQSAVRDPKENLLLTTEAFVISPDGHTEEMTAYASMCSDFVEQASAGGASLVYLRSTLSSGPPRGVRVWDRGAVSQFGWTVEVALGRNRVFFLAENLLGVLAALDLVDCLFPAPSAGERPVYRVQVPPDPSPEEGG